MDCSFWLWSLFVCLLHVCTPCLFICLPFLVLIHAPFGVCLFVFSLFCLFIWLLLALYVAPFGVKCAPFGFCLPICCCLVLSLLFKSVHSALVSCLLFVWTAGFGFGTTRLCLVATFRPSWPSSGDAQ